MVSGLETLEQQGSGTLQPHYRGARMFRVCAKGVQVLHHLIVIILNRRMRGSSIQPSLYAYQEQYRLNSIHRSSVCLQRICYGASYFGLCAWPVSCVLMLIGLRHPCFSSGSLGLDTVAGCMAQRGKHPREIPGTLGPLPSWGIWGAASRPCGDPGGRASCKQRTRNRLVRYTCKEGETRW